MTVTALCSWLAVALASVGCGTSTPLHSVGPAPDSCVAEPLPDSTSPTRQGFFREVLFPAPTARTPRYDDYTDVSYHVDKLDIAAALPAEAERCGASLRALLVIGPVGPLWTYHVIGFLSDSDSVRVTSLVMPHARITEKGSGSVPDSTLANVIARITRSPLIQMGIPSFADSADALTREFSFDLLLVQYGTGDSPRYWHGKVSGSGINYEAADTILASVNSVLGATRTTYPDSAKLAAERARRASRPPWESPSLRRP